MNNSVKLLLTIDLVGTLGESNKGIEIIPFSYDLDENRKKINEVSGMSKHRNKTVRKCTQHIKMTQDAYNFMISSEVPYWSKEEVWKKLSDNDRIKLHCERIANGNKFNFQILE